MKKLSFHIGIAAVFASIATAAPAWSQRPDIGFARRDSVVLAIPFGAASEYRLGGLLGLQPRFVFDVDLDSIGAVIVRDSTGHANSEWRAVGFPTALPYMVEQINTLRRPGGVRVVEVVLRSGGVAGRVFVPEGKEAAFRQVLAPRAAADSVFAAGYRALAQRIFTGPLATFSDAERMTVLGWAHLKARGTTIGSETYRGVQYLTVDLPASDSVWNDLVVRQNRRLGVLLVDNFAMMKAFARLSIPHASIGGVKLSTKSCHGTAPSYSNMRCDPVEIFFPLASLVRFADDEITTQQLVNESVVRISGDRIEVDLSGQ